MCLLGDNSDETMQSMGHYLCPRCCGTETYLGNTLVKRDGVTLAREVGDSGVYVAASSGGTETAQVRKCKKCGEILTNNNYVKSAADVAEKESRDKFARQGILFCGFMGFGIGFGAILYAEGTGGHAVIGGLIGGLFGLVTAYLLSTQDES